MPNGQLSYHKMTEADFKRINEELAKRDTMEILKWAYGQFGDQLVYACSFGAEGIVLIDLISKVRKDASVIFLDTHLHFKETYDLIKRVKNRYPDLNIQMIEPDLTLKQQTVQYGEELWKKDPDLCCQLRKIQPLKKVLFNKQAWISGLRRDQAHTRAGVQYVNADHKFQSIKICPLIHWTWGDVWDYIRFNRLTYNELHDRGYPSIGCEACTVPVEDGKDLRAGRWSNTEKTECGLHS